MHLVDGEPAFPRIPLPKGCRNHSCLVCVQIMWACVFTALLSTPPNRDPVSKIRLESDNTARGKRSEKEETRGARHVSHFVRSCVLCQEAGNTNTEWDDAGFSGFQTTGHSISLPHKAFRRKAMRVSCFPVFRI